MQKRVSFKMAHKSVKQLGKAVALVSLIMLLTTSTFLAISARYVLEWDPSVMFGVSVNKTDLGEDLVGTV